MDLLSIDEAAERMGLHPAHVRRLARTGALPARKVGARWFVGDDAVRERKRLQAPRGRPLSPDMAWVVLGLADAALRGDDGSGAGSDDPAESVAEEPRDRRARYRLRHLLAAAPPAERWAAWLRRRAAPRRVWVHPGVIDALAADPRVHPGGGAAAIAAGLGVGAGVGGPAVFYVEDADADQVVADYRAVDDPDGRTALMVVPGRALAGPTGTRARRVGAAVGLVDMLSSADARERHVAAGLLDHALDRIRSAPPQ